MRYRTMFGVLAAAVVGSVFVVNPAFAATTTGEVTDVVVVHATDENFVYGDYVPWEPEGPAVFPSVVDANEGPDEYVLQAYQPVVPAPAQGCTVEVASFSVDVEILRDEDTSGPQIGFFVGLPADTVSDTTVEFDGVGSTATNGSYFEVFAVDGELNGTLTLTLPEAIDPEAVPFGWLGFFTDAVDPGPLWQVNGVSFGTVTTCPELPATGIEPTGPALAAVALLVVGGAFVLWRARRAAGIETFSAP